MENKSKTEQVADSLLARIEHAMKVSDGVS